MVWYCQIWRNMRIVQYKDLNTHKSISELNWKIPLSNDQVQRYIKNQNITKENICIQIILMKISIVMVAGFAISVSARNYSLTKIIWIWVHIPIPSFTQNYNTVICYTIMIVLKDLSMENISNAYSMVWNHTKYIQL